MGSYSKDLRLKVLAAIDRGAPRREVVETFGVSLATLKRWLKKHRSCPALRQGAQGERAYGKAPRNWGKNITLISSITLDEGLGASMSIEGSADRDSFSRYLEEVLCPALRRGQIVVMDNLSVHKSKRVRDLIEQRGCELWFLPAYSPDLNLIEEAFSKVKGILRKTKARTLEALFEATARALRAVGEEDARGFFGHCGYLMLQAH